MEAFDVVVLGTGAAGLTAAIAAHEGGATVAVFEKADKVGGTTAWSGGQVWIPNNPHMPEVGVADSRDKAITYIMSLSRDMLERAARRGLRRRRARRWSSCSRPRRRCSSMPSPACPTTTPSSRAAARRAAARSSARSSLRRARRLGRPRHAVALLRRPAHHDERDPARQGRPRAAVAGGARSAARCTTSAAAVRRWPAGCCRAASTAASSRARRAPAAS